MSGHALLSPSAASRWLACTPSARLEQQFPNTSSSYADEGTLAHAVGECILRELAGMISHAEAETIMAVHLNNQYYSKELHDYAEGYAYYVWNQCKPGKTELFIETRLDMTDYVEEGFGTADAIIVADNILKFFDYKHGKGVRVNVDDNPQVKLYALGAYKEFRHIFDINVIEMTIYQPRIDNVETWSITIEDLLDWAENDLKPKAALAYAGEGEFNPGRACLFCKAKATCRALHDYNMKLMELEFKNPDLLSDEEIASVLKQSALVESWLEAVAGYALSTAISGEKTWPGYKIVQGRSVRKYGDEKTVEATLIAAGFTDIFNKKLLGLGDMEKKITKPKFAEIVEPLLIRPEGKPTLVPEVDKRPAFAVASSEFTSYVEDDI